MSFSFFHDEQEKLQHLECIVSGVSIIIHQHILTDMESGTSHLRTCHEFNERTYTSPSTLSGSFSVGASIPFGMMDKDSSSASPISAMSCSSSVVGDSSDELVDMILLPNLQSLAVSVMEEDQQMLMEQDDETKSVAASTEPPSGCSSASVSGSCSPFVPESTTRSHMKLPCRSSSGSPTYGRRRSNPASPTYHQEVPSQSQIYEFLMALYKRGDFMPCSVLGSLILLQRFKRTTKMALTPDNWKATSVICLVVAQKIYEDVPLANAEFCKLYSVLPSKSIGKLEMFLMKHMNFDIGIDHKTYRDSLSQLVQLVSTFQSSVQRKVVGAVAASPCSPMSPSRARKTPSHHFVAPSSPASSYAPSPVVSGHTSPISCSPPTSAASYVVSPTSSRQHITSPISSPQYTRSSSSTATCSSMVSPRKSNGAAAAAAVPACKNSRSQQLPHIKQSSSQQQQVQARAQRLPAQNVLPQLQSSHRRQASLSSNSNHSKTMVVV